MGNGGFTGQILVKAQGNSTNTCIHAFSFLLAKHRKHKPSSVKLLLPIIAIGIVACAFVLLWENICRNNCTQIFALRLQ